jgi:hypothetical protein
MKSVPRFEANLLRILQGFLGHTPREQVLPLLSQVCPRPRCLTRPGVELIQDRLAKGCVLFLARAGGWRHERHLRGEHSAEGRLWERTPSGELGLEFSGHALRFLVWATASGWKERSPAWDPAANELGVGDLLLCYLAYTAFRGTGPGEVLRGRRALVGNGLCRLSYPEDFTGPRRAEIDFRPWTHGTGACVLEALQHDLACKWLALERGKARCTHWGAMRALGEAQDAVLGAFLPALERAGRQDLAAFLLRAAAGVLTPQAEPADWVGALQASALRLEERTAVYRAALAFVRALDGFRRWERDARGVGYLDEGYAAAQLWKAAWERWDGDTLHARARELGRRLDPMTFTAGGQPS